MVFWFTCFRLPTKKASSFLASAKKLIREKWGMEWNVSEDVGERITKIHFYEPMFGYRVDLSTPLETIRQAEKEFNKLVKETRMALLELADRYGATVEVVNSKGTRFVEPKRLLEAEKAENDAVKIFAEAFRKAKPIVAEFEDILALDSIIEKAKNHMPY